MNSYGTVRLVSEDALFFLGKFLFLYLTIPLTMFWLLIGYFVKIDDTVVASISGPAYFFIAFFAIGGYKSLCQVAIGLGSTRVQFLKVFYTIGIIAVVLSIICLNILQYLLKMIYDQWEIGAKILHPGIFLVSDYHFFAYLWIDIMFGIFLFGVSFLLFTIYYRLGMRKSFILIMILAIIGMFLYYAGYLNSSIEWFLGLDLDRLGFWIITMIGIMSIGALGLTYPIMRHAPLQPKTKKD